MSVILIWSFSAIFGQFWSRMAKIDSKSAPLRGVARCVWPCGGRGSVAGSQVTRKDVRNRNCNRGDSNLGREKNQSTRKHMNKIFTGLSRDYPGTVPGPSRPFPEISWELGLCVSLFPQEKGKHINNLTPIHFRDNPAKLFMFFGFCSPPTNLCHFRSWGSHPRPELRRPAFRRRESREKKSDSVKRHLSQTPP